MPRSLALGVGLAALALLAGCGGDDAAGGDEPSSGTSLTIDVRLDAESEFDSYTLTCEPTGGDHPLADKACAALGSVDISDFEPTGDGQACTMIYGGPQEARVHGTFGGEKFDATFTYENGCEIARWDALGPDVLVLPTN